MSRTKAVGWSRGIIDNQQYVLELLLGRASPFRDPALARCVEGTRDMDQRVKLVEEESRVRGFENTPGFWFHRTVLVDGNTQNPILKIEALASRDRPFLYAVIVRWWRDGKWCLRAVLFERESPEEKCS